MVCFFDDPMSRTTNALVQEVHHQTDANVKNESQLFAHWTLRAKANNTTKRNEAVFSVFPVAAFSDRMCAIDPQPIGGFSRPEGCDFDMLVVKCIEEEWPAEFLKSDSCFMPSK